MRSLALSKGSHFSGLPSTLLGRVSAAAFLAALVFMVVMSTAFESVSPTVGQLNVVPAIGALTMLVALVTGAVALINKGERSWAVWLSTVLPAMLLGAELFLME